MKKRIIITAVMCLLIVAIAYATDTVEILLRGGAGSSNYAKINKNNQLETESITISGLQDASESGEAYSWAAVTANLGAGGTALCVVNTSTTKDLVIEKVYCWSDVASDIDIHLPAVATWAGTAVTGVCLNRELSKTADAVAYANETGNTQANLVATLHTNETATDIHGLEYDLQGGVILGYNDAIAVDIAADSGAFTCNIVGYYR